MKFSGFLVKALKGIGRLLRNNLALKIAAVFFAVILWSYVMAETNPPRPKTVDNIPVKLINLEALKSRGLTVAENISNILKGVRVNLEVKQKELSLVNSDNVSASIDFSSITSKGETKLKINCKTQFGTAISWEPSFVTLTIDDYIKKPIPVSCAIKGMQPLGYFAGEPSVSPNVVQIAGARKDVEKAASAICEVDLTNKTSSINQSVDVKILDSKGNVLDNTVYFENLPSVIVKADILPIKKAVVNAADSVINASKLKEGYEITKVTSDPAEIEIAGESQVLDSISQVFLSDMDVSGASADMVFKVNPKAVEGLRFLNSSPLNVTVNIAQIQGKKTYNEIPVAVLNQPSGHKVLIKPKTVDVTLFGGVKDIERLRRSDIKLFVDLSGLQKGTYNLPVKNEGFNSINLTDIKFSKSELTVTIE